MKKLSATVVVALGLLLAACSGGSDGPAATSPPATPPASVPPPAPASAEPTAASSPSAENEPAGPGPECLDGTYQVENFRAVGVDKSTAKGTGGDLTMTFDDGSFVMASKGRDPATFTVNGDTGELVLDGKLTGTYAPTGDDKVAFKVGKASGTAKLRDPKGDERSVTVKQLAGVLAPNGTATVTCEGDELTLDNKQLTLELAR